jgi:4-hydroxybenzoate polyprenyltransferase
MIRFPHTVFALPFAPMGAVLAAGGIPPRDKLLWILIAMVGARSGVMRFTVACLTLLIPLLNLDLVHAGWLSLAVTLLLYEHWLLHRHGLTKLDVAFFNVNGFLSIGIFPFTLGDLLPS